MSTEVLQNDQNKIPVIAVVGPTASGKTALGVHLAKYYDGEVISADSMQIYTGMDIATAKPSPEEMQGVRHHLMGFLPVTARYSVAQFTVDANRCARDIVRRNKKVLLVGGTGLYVDALLQNVTFEEEPENTEMRAFLFRRRETEGIEALYKELSAIDPAYAVTLDPHNEKRVLRALEIYYLSGQTPTVRRARAVGHESDFLPVYIGLRFRDRELLYDRIARRSDRMLADGLLEEARSYYGLDGVNTASQAIGYKEFAPFFAGEISFEEARENLIRATRRYAKRQLTWFGRNPDVHWIDCDEKNEADIFACAVKITDKHFGKEAQTL
ncbi:MAG: tRNA (adenosine(37)-N6)-dimethylallyltransferase MiaA [Clostridia bacterium]|nr:tRNA (adenosine(37)-N6)-dimethylallyltransferase MiaA [Clostridia bacterium]